MGTFDAWQEEGGELELICDKCESPHYFEVDNYTCEDTEYEITCNNEIYNEEDNDGESLCGNVIKFFVKTKQLAGVSKVENGSCGYIV